MHAARIVPTTNCVFAASESPHDDTTTSSATEVRPSTARFNSLSVPDLSSPSQPDMEDEYQLAAMQPTAGYLFAEELDAHFLALDDFHAMLLQDDLTAPKVTAVDSSFSLLRPSPTTGCVLPSSPSSVVYLPPCCPPPVEFYDFEPLVKQEPMVFTASPNHNNEGVFVKPEYDFDNVPQFFAVRRSPQPLPIRVILDDTINDEDKERLRRRQRGYEKRYRGRKRKDLTMQRDAWLSLEMKLDAVRKECCRPYVRIEQGGHESLRYKLLLLKLEERALRQDRIAMHSLQAWEEISRIREYSDKDKLRTVSEWRHSADKVIGRSAVLGPSRFHPYAPLEQYHFTW